MSRKRATIIFLLLMAFGSSGFFFSSCKDKSIDGMIIITRTNFKNGSPNYVTGDLWRYLPMAQIAILDPSKPDGSVKILTGDFWEMDLTNFRTTQITRSTENSTDPAYMPLGSLVFSKFDTDDKLKGGHSIYTCNMDGSNMQRVTFNPHSYFASNVLSDGRILTIDRQIYPESSNPEYLIFRPDGTKTELFFKGNENSILSGQGLETADGRIVFIESDKNEPSSGGIISVSYSRPLHSKINLTAEIKGDFHSVYPQHSGKMLVSYRKSETDRYSLYEFDPETKTLGQEIYKSSDFDILEAVEVWKHVRPKKLPSEVHMDIKTGLIVCQDVNLRDPSANSPVSKISSIEIVGIDSLLGVFKPAEDGSFYLRVLADIPFRIRSLDNKGNVLQTCNWIWLRPNERRGCIGCHENQELVPENRIPLSVKKSPISIPMHVNKIKEKMIDTE
jgi:hypothetical protein